MTEPLVSPAWLTAALDAVDEVDEVEHRRLDSDLRDQSPADLLPGDICVVTPYDNTGVVGRLFLVTDSDPGHCAGMLVSAETEFASEVDAILLPAETGLPYPIAALTRFSGPLWTTQVRRRVGAVPTAILDQLLALAWSDEPKEVTVVRGVALQPERVDPRYPALRALSDELDALTDHCRRRPDLGVFVLDPVLAEIDVLRVVLAERGWEETITAAGATPDFRDRLLGSFNQLSKDEQRAASPFIERALNALPDSNRGITPLISGHRDAAAVGRAVASVGHRGPVITVLSHRRCRTTAGSLTTRIRDGASETTLVLTSISELRMLEAV